jgi:uncharacterized membrane protein
MTLLFRFLTYGIFGWVVEILFTSISNSYKKKSWQLKGFTYLWMFPIYGFGGLLFEMVYNYFLTQEFSFIVRMPIYLIGLYVIELVAGFILLKLTGNYVWKYEGKWQYANLINFLYAPLWILFLIALEWLNLFLNRIVIL